MMGMIKGIRPPSNQIWYDAESKVTLFTSKGVISHSFNEGRGVIIINSSAGDAWLRNSTVTKVYAPSGLSATGQYFCSQCPELLEVIVADGVQKISGYSFYICPKLKAVTLPASVTTIETQAFRNCSALINLTILASIPPTLAGTSIQGTTCPIYVPAESVEVYKAASGWSAYASRIFAIPE